jgi:hypothetical protein
MSIEEFEWWHSIQGFSENFDIHDPLKEDGSKYQDNAHGFRCDEFITNHKGKHILFSGCSYTYGSGLKKEEVWAYKVYDKINKNEGASGYFNLGLGGNNIINSILNIFKYCKKFGNPDIIFINLTSESRFFDYKEDEKQYRIVSHNVFHDKYHIAKLINYNFYFILEQYCKSNNIQLFSFSWNLYDEHFLNKQKNNLVNIILKSTNDSFKDYNFKTFYYINEEYLYNELFLLKEKYDNPFFETARDIIKHRGNGIHMFWADFIYNKYLENNKK